VLGSGDFLNRTTPIVVVDLAVPRGVERDVDALENVTRLDIGDLQQRVALALEGRREALNDAEALVRSDVEKFLDDQRARGAAALVSQLRDYFDGVVTSEFERRASELAQLDDDARAIAESMVRSVVAKLAHRPTTTLKEASGTDQGLRLSEATRTLFGL
jgi:glutamyl-tRNA reductase